MRSASATSRPAAPQSSRGVRARAPAHRHKTVTPASRSELPPNVTGALPVSYAHLMFEAEIEDTVAFLESDRALEMIAADPYWPKWTGPWWRMLFLWVFGVLVRFFVCVVRALVLC